MSVTCQGNIIVLKMIKKKPMAGAAQPGCTQATIAGESVSPTALPEGVGDDIAIIERKRLGGPRGHIVRPGQR